jgi:hypothetical protein
VDSLYNTRHGDVLEARGAIGCDSQRNLIFEEWWEEEEERSTDCGNNLIQSSGEEEEERSDDSPHNPESVRKEGVLEGPSNDCVDILTFEGWKGDLEGMSSDCMNNIIL